MRFRSHEIPLRTQLIKRPRRASKEYEFLIGRLHTPVRARLNLDASDRVWFETSHFVHTPEQALPYRTSVTGSETEREALQLAVDSLLGFYRKAVDAGHKPAESWLVPNGDFGWRP